MKKKKKTKKKTILKKFQCCKFRIIPLCTLTLYFLHYSRLFTFIMTSSGPTTQYAYVMVIIKVNQQINRRSKSMVSIIMKFLHFAKQNPPKKNLNIFLYIFKENIVCDCEYRKLTIYRNLPAKLFHVLFQPYMEDLRACTLNILFTENNC